MQKRTYLIAGAVLFLGLRPAFADPPAQTTEQQMTLKKPTSDQEKALLAPYRVKIDRLDAQIVALLGERFGVVREVAKLKAERGIAPILPERIEQVVHHAREKAEKAGVDPNLIEQIYRIVIDTACKEEEEYAKAQQVKAQ